MQDHPCDNPQKVTTLINEALSEAEKHFGLRDPSWTLGSHFFGEQNPELLFFPNNEIRIRLSDAAGKNWFTATHEIAHEVTHVLCPVRRERDTRLEEGCACWHANVFYRLRTHQHAGKPKDNYLRPYELVRKIMTHSSTAIATARADGRSFADIHSTTFSAILSSTECEFLHSCFFDK